MDREVVAKLLFLAGMAFVLMVATVLTLFVVAVMVED
jgi:hypothetical protein